MPETSITLDLEHRQQDEISSISSIYGDIFKDITPTGLVGIKTQSISKYFYHRQIILIDRLFPLH